MTKFSKKLLITAFLLFLPSCAKDSQVVLVPLTNLRKISFSAEEDMNDKRVLIVHMVVPKKKELYDELLKMDSQAYFAVNQQLKTDYPNDLEIFTWEIIPGSAINDIDIRFSDFRAQGIIIFAQYDDSFPGLHKLVLPHQRSVRVLLGRTECTMAY
ncbi:MAG: hypothetical protein LBF84_00730 [Holosporales bacterium]|jgi:hypothetical protein|nr:hypothetical protein [Holosporales bacterium]